MKILHTSDLHIGKKLMGRERYREYVAVLEEIRSICVEEKVELALIAGDVFDSYTPSAEAEQIFYDGIKKIAEASTALIISGNHDDYVRLRAASSFAEEQRTYIVGNNLQPLPVKVHAGAYPVQSDCGYAVFANEAGERVYFDILPYPNEARLKEGKSDETFAEKMRRWINYGERGNSENLPSVLLSHIFVAGGKVSESEREIDLGGARAVGLDLLPDCCYCALGHLHRRQKLGDNAYYSGAPMRFSFDECGSKKSVNIFEITASGLKNFKQVELKNIKNLVRLQANGVEEGIKILSEYPDSYAELTLNLAAPITPADSALLRSMENLVSIKADVRGSQKGLDRISNKNKSASQLFNEYYKSRFDVEAPKELLSLFLSLTEEE